MRAFPIEVGGDGRLRLSASVVLPANVRLGALVLDKPAEQAEELSGADIARLAEESGALDFLREEPDLYTDADIESGQQNPDFGRKDAPAR